MRRAAWALAVLTSASCVDITVDKGAIGSLEFVVLPYPSVDAGDTLRDSLGKVAPLRGNAYRGDGSLDAAIPIAFLSFDTTVTLDASRGFVVGKRLSFAAATSFPARLVASAGTLQSGQRRLDVVPRPDSVEAPKAGKDSILYSVPSSPNDVSSSLTVRLFQKGSTALGVPSYIVRFKLLSKRGDTVLVANDTSRSFVLQDDAGRLSSVDTTDAQGQASRKVRYRIRSGAPSIDTVRVLAEVRRGSRIVPGDTTLKWTVVVRPK